VAKATDWNIFVSIYYKYGQYLNQSDDGKFDKVHEPGVATPHSGVYRCTNCGKECTSVVSHPLPPQNHHQHPNRTPIRWQLVVWG